MYNSGMLLIISGPSGSGKGTVVQRLSPEKNYALSISVTTRKQRMGERNGEEYFFIKEEAFNAMRDSGQLLEHAVFCGNCYGTPLSYVEEQTALGKVVVLEIEVNGALQVREIFKNAVLVFLIPPTIDELSRRLISRNTDDWESIEDRLRRAREEIKLIDQYDYLIVNDDIDNAVDMINTIVKAESSRPSRNLNTIIEFKGDDAGCLNLPTAN